MFCVCSLTWEVSARVIQPKCEMWWLGERPRDLGISVLFENICNLMQPTLSWILNTSQYVIHSHKQAHNIRYFIITVCLSDSSGLIRFVKLATQHRPMASYALWFIIGLIRNKCWRTRKAPIFINMLFCQCENPIQFGPNCHYHAASTLVSLAAAVVYNL